MHLVGFLLCGKIHEDSLSSRMEEGNVVTLEQAMSIAANLPGLFDPV
jgi:hypothetical protein